eukprot:m.430754 g.430754  ORF g.430754 m.430754 type:complete len:77 (+) comp17209_c0_seq1:989-1219(+)
MHFEHVNYHSIISSPPSFLDLSLDFQHTPLPHTTTLITHHHCSLESFTCKYNAIYSARSISSNAIWKSEEEAQNTS